ncbi:hypothetical protein P0136_00115 [Lentisphaerota bacterium ZTH]|nr:hypothetical protein JYG24_08740 [Lentisphaerota bacterium]WET06421.1 hypothetical protein P0136_00115 [Lentisphaerota bacterium ZTH]
MGKKQLGFDFFSNESFEKEKVKKERKSKGQDTERIKAVQESSAVDKKLPSSKPRSDALHLRQAVLKWLVGLSPAGIGVKVPTRIKKYQVEAAAFWSCQDKLKKRAEKTLLVEVMHDRDHCWPDCSDLDTLLHNIRSLKEEKLRLEEVIRKEEPELKDRDTLFDEYQRWNYTASKNRQYQRCIKQIDRAHHSLYKGSRLELIRQAHVADYIYVAVPEGTIHPHELVDGWGLLYVKPDGEIIEEKKAQRQTCSAENRMHLIQNIAASCMNSLLFTNGVNLKSTGDVFLTRPPRRRRK